MPDSNSIENNFLKEITSIIESNMANEQFGVTDLADKTNMSRSNLLRKVKKLTNLSVSQLISQVRLQRGMELLRQGTLNVSGVSHQVGFSSTSYFIKCFREYYGYPPGEVGKKNEVALAPKPSGILPVDNMYRRRKYIIGGTAVMVLILAAILFAFYPWSTSRSDQVEKSIAVLPFINDSNDSTNLYLINGLMESTLNNLQQIKELKVISRTSAEKYRNTSKSIPEIAKELNVNYIVEGSGQKIGDQILLNIQLIDASSDKHLWGNQYRKESKDIFELQQEVAKSIAQEIQAIITPDEKNRIEKKPTDDLLAYDLFLKGRNYFVVGDNEKLEKAIAYFNQAIERDPEFAMAYANAAMAYYYSDLFQREKKFADDLARYADKAVLIDPKLTESLIAKALVSMSKKDFQSAVPYLEKALEYNPNSMFAISSLADFYCDYLPNTTLYLEYALKGVRLENGSADSITTSYNYLRLGNALIQNGFVDESLKYIDRSFEYYPQNPYSKYIRAFILYAKGGTLEQTRELLLKEFKKDTARLDILQDLGKVSYYMRDFEGAFKYDNRLIELRDVGKMDVYKHENLRMAYVQAKMGQKEKSEELLKSYKEFADNDKSIYHNLALAQYYNYLGDSKKSLEYLKLFSKEENFQYWVVLFLEKDPICDKTTADAKKVLKDIYANFWNTHEEIKLTLEDKELL